MNNKEITTELNGSSYPHGEVRVVKKDLSEWKVEIEADLVISSCDYEQLHDEIQDVIRKYSI